MTFSKGDEVVVRFPFTFEDPQPTAEGVVEGIDGDIVIIRGSFGDALPFPSHLVTKKEQP